MKNEDEWKDFLNKTVRIIYEDGPDHYSKKIGRIISINKTHVILSTGTSKIALCRSKVLRIET